jgi:hypothetical protein
VTSLAIREISSSEAWFPRWAAAGLSGEGPSWARRLSAAEAAVSKPSDLGNRCGGAHAQRSRHIIAQELGERTACSRVRVSPCVHPPSRSGCRACSHSRPSRKIRRQHPITQYQAFAHARDVVELRSLCLSERHSWELRSSWWEVLLSLL